MEDDIEKLLGLIETEEPKEPKESEVQSSEESEGTENTESPQETQEPETETETEDDFSDVFIDPESVSMALEFSKRYTRLLIQKKDVSQSVKDLRKEYDEQGLPTSLVMKAFARLKAEKKENNLDEIKAFKKYMAQNAEVMELIDELNS